LAIYVFAQEGEFEPVELPDKVAEKVEDLDQEKVDFIRGPRIFQFASDVDYRSNNLPSPGKGR